MTNELKAKVSRAILAQVVAGLTVREAIDAVLGAGSAASIISDVYETLKAANK